MTDVNALMIKNHIKKTYNIIRVHPEMFEAYDLVDKTSGGIVNKWDVSVFLCKVFEIHREELKRLFKELINEKIEELKASQIKIEYGKDTNKVFR